MQDLMEMPFGSLEERDLKPEHSVREVFLKKEGMRHLIRNSLEVLLFEDEALRQGIFMRLQESLTSKGLAFNEDSFMYFVNEKLMYFSAEKLTEYTKILEKHFAISRQAEEEERGLSSLEKREREVQRQEAFLDDICGYFFGNDEYYISDTSSSFDFEETEIPTQLA